jgi:hypothetical protein
VGGRAGGRVCADAAWVWADVREGASEGGKDRGNERWKEESSERARGAGGRNKLRPRIGSVRANAVTGPRKCSHGSARKQLGSARTHACVRTDAVIYS